jgi:hypothetical protein
MKRHRGNNPSFLEDLLKKGHPELHFCRIFVELMAVRVPKESDLKE